MIRSSEMEGLTRKFSDCATGAREPVEGRSALLCRDPTPAGAQRWTRRVAASIVTLFARSKIKGCSSLPETVHLLGIERRLSSSWMSPFSEVISCARADANVVLVVIDLVFEGSYEIVDLRNAERDAAAYVELNASA